MGYQDEFVLLTSFLVVNQADMARMLLESEGLDCFLTNDRISTANPFFGPATGGVGLWVRDEHCEDAIRILRENDFDAQPDQEQAQAMSDNLSSFFRESKGGKLFLAFWLILLAIYGLILVFGGAFFTRG